MRSRHNAACASQDPHAKNMVLELVRLTALHGSRLLVREIAFQPALYQQAAGTVKLDRRVRASWARPLLPTRGRRQPMAGLGAHDDLLASPGTRRRGLGGPGPGHPRRDVGARGALPSRSGLVTSCDRRGVWVHLWPMWSPDDEVPAPSETQHSALHLC